MTVEQHRGERNHPAYLPYCLRALAQAKSMQAEEVASCTTSNAREIWDYRRMSYAYFKRLNKTQKKIYLASDKITRIELTNAGALQTTALEIKNVLPQEMSLR